MADSTSETAAEAGQSAGEAVGGAISGVTDLAGRTAARTREEAEDIWADARAVADGDGGRVSASDAAMYAGLAATVAIGVIEWPVAAAVGVGYALVRRSGGWHASS